MSLRVVTVDDNARYRGSLETLLTHADGVAFAGSFSSAAAAVAAVEALPRPDCPPWDLVLMDLELPGISGIEGTRRLKHLAPRIPIVVLTVFEDPATVLEAICAGADGYLLKRLTSHELLSQLRGVMSGGAPLTARVARTVLDLVRRGDLSRPPVATPTRLELTEREQAVLRGLVQGMAYKQVAHDLGVSLDTVRSHIRNVYRKLQVHSVAEAVSRAIREGLV